MKAETLEACLPRTDQPRVVIIGGGFGGLEVAKGLRDAPAQVVLLDRNNYHTFQPLFYQVATSALAVGDIVTPYRDYFKDQPNFYFRMAEVHQVLPENQEVQTSVGKVHYDYLVIGTGTRNNFFGNQQIAEKAFPLKALEDSLGLRNHILANFEQALLTPEEEERNSLIDFVVVGGGPTGVEVAGALAELRNHVFQQDYKELNVLKEMDITLVEGSPRLLPPMSEEAGQKAQEFLEKLGVEVVLQQLVTDYDGYRATLKDGRQYITQTLIWGAGVTGAPIPGFEEACLAKGGRYRVDEYHRIRECERIYAIGDIALMETEAYPQGHPQQAQPAIQQGRHLAQNLRKLLRREKEISRFRYQDKGSMATVGKNLAVADTRYFKLQGFLAWLLWGLVHANALPGKLNRLTVTFNWFWSYLSTNKAHRYIVGDQFKEKLLESFSQRYEQTEENNHQG